MKTRTLISVICSLIINGLYTFNRPAIAEQLPSALHIADALIITNSDADEADSGSPAYMG